MSNQAPSQRVRPMLTLGRVRGVPVLVSPSWLVIGIALTAVYGPIVRDSVPDLADGLAYLAAFGFSILYALCILAHELGHTLVSTLLGYPVKRVVLFVLGGVSEIEGEPQRAGHELAIAAAGPLVSIVISGGAFGAFFAFEDASLTAVLFALLAWTNAVLAVFNLLPGLPLDGGRILRAAVWGFGASQLTGTRVAAWSGRVLAVAVLVAGLILNVRSEHFLSAFIGVLLAAYLWVSATQSLKAAELLDRLPEVRVADLLRPGLLVPADLSVAEALRRVWESGARGLVLLDPADRPSAIVDESLISAVPVERRPWTPVSEVAHPLEPGRTVPLDIEPKDLLTHMQETPAREYLALGDDGAPAGIIATVDLARRLQAQP